MPSIIEISDSESEVDNAPVRVQDEEDQPAGIVSVSDLFPSRIARATGWTTGDARMFQCICKNVLAEQGLLAGSRPWSEWSHTQKESIHREIRKEFLAVQNIEMEAKHYHLLKQTCIRLRKNARKVVLHRKKARNDRPFAASQASNAPQPGDIGQLVHQDQDSQANEDAENLATPEHGYNSDSDFGHAQSSPVARSSLSNSYEAGPPGSRRTRSPEDPRAVEARKMDKRRNRYKTLEAVVCSKMQTLFEEGVSPAHTLDATIQAIKEALPETAGHLDEQLVEKLAESSSCETTLHPWTFRWFRRALRRMAFQDVMQQSEVVSSATDVANRALKAAANAAEQLSSSRGDAAVHA